MSHDILCLDTSNWLSLYPADDTFGILDRMTCNENYDLSSPPDYSEEDEHRIHEIAENLKRSVGFHTENPPSYIKNRPKPYYRMEVDYSTDIAIPHPTDNERPMLNDIENIDYAEFTVQDSLSGKTRAPKLCEFLLQLLVNPSYASYASWLDQSSGFFKIHKPEEVAQLWGQVKGRRTQGKMNYSSFSRSIRFNYDGGIVAGTRRKHIYRFARV